MYLKYITSSRVSSLISDLIANNGLPPPMWKPAATNGAQNAAAVPPAPQEEVEIQDVPIVQDGAAAFDVPVMIDDPQPGPSREETDEEKIASKLKLVTDLFPQTDPEFLQQKIAELIGDEALFQQWVQESVDKKGEDFPSREAYEKRQEVRVLYHFKKTNWTVL